MKNPSIWHLKELFRWAQHSSVGIGEGKSKVWVPCRALGFSGLRNRFRCAWLVFTGKADALIWPEGQ